MNKINIRFGFFFGIYVDCQGLSGGFCLFWSDSINVILFSYSKGHIDVKVNDSSIANAWRLTGYYRHLEIDP